MKFHRVERSMSGAYYGWVETEDEEGRPCSRPFKFFGREPSVREVEDKATEVKTREEAARVAAE